MTERERDDLSWTRARNLIVIAASGGVVWMGGQIYASVNKLRDDVTELKIELRTKLAEGGANTAALESRLQALESIEAKR